MPVSEDTLITTRIYRIDPESRKRAKVDERYNSTEVEVPRREHCDILFDIEVENGDREFYIDGLNKNAELWVFESVSQDSRMTERVYQTNVEFVRDMLDDLVQGEKDGFLMMSAEEVHDLLELIE